LELGSCAGISSCYLASASACQRFLTIEGSVALAAIAAANLRQVTNKAQVINSLFDEGLLEILPNLHSGLDLVYIDGHHDQAATLHYLELLRPHLNPDCLIVFDDIRLYRNMWDTWRMLCQTPGFTTVVDVGRFGLAVWAGTMAQPKVFDFSILVGQRKIGGLREVVSNFRLA